MFSAAAQFLSGTRPMPAWRAARLVAARLRDLGRPADLLTDGAIARLCSEAHGSPSRLHALLASALFLASTEDAPAIDADLVRRAAVSLGAHEPEAAPPHRRSPMAAPWLARPWVIAGVLAFALASTVLLVRHPRQNAAPAGTQLATPQPAPTPRPPTLPAPAHAGVAPLTNNAPPPALPTRAARPPLAVPAVLPAGPPVSVIIRYRAGDTAAESTARAIVQRLADTNVKAALRPGSRVTRASVRYFYENDRALALRIAADTRERLPPPRREDPFDGKTLAYPGTIEVALP
jgi:hypothetical protein